MIVARLIAPASKLATARMLDPLTAASSLGEVLGLGPVDEDEFFFGSTGRGAPAGGRDGARPQAPRDGIVLYDFVSYWRGAAANRRSAATTVTQECHCRSSTSCCGIRPPGGAEYSRRLRLSIPHAFRHAFDKSCFMFRRCSL